MTRSKRPLLADKEIFAYPYSAPEQAGNTICRRTSLLGAAVITAALFCTHTLENQAGLCYTDSKQNRKDFHTMRLTQIQNLLKQKSISFQYWEEDDCGSITFLHHGLNYHIWEYPEPERGADSNVRTAGRSEDFGADYEEAILAILQSW